MTSTHSLTYSHGMPAASGQFRLFFVVDLLEAAAMVDVSPRRERRFSLDKVECKGIIIPWFAFFLRRIRVMVEKNKV